jgi:hypothetical protein
METQPVEAASVAAQPVMDVGTLYVRENLTCLFELHSCWFFSFVPVPR